MPGFHLCSSLSETPASALLGVSALCFEDHAVEWAHNFKLLKFNSFLSVAVHYNLGKNKSAKLAYQSACSYSLLMWSP